MAWTDQEIEAVREAIEKQEELIRPKMVGIRKVDGNIKEGGGVR